MLNRFFYLGFSLIGVMLLVAVVVLSGLQWQSPDFSSNISGLQAVFYEENDLDRDWKGFSNESGIFIRSNQSLIDTYVVCSHEELHYLNSDWSHDRIVDSHFRYSERCLSLVSSYFI